MSVERLDDAILDQVVGGQFVFHRKSRSLTYSHMDGSVTNHNLLDYDKAWELSNMLHAQHVPEDEILDQLINKGYVAE